MALCDSINKSSPTNYRLVFPLLPTEITLASTKPLTLNIFSSVIPSLTLDVTDESWQGTKRKMANGPIAFGDWSVNFVVDSNFLNWQIIFNWMNYINNNYNKHMEEHKNYSVDASLDIMDNFRNSILAVNFASIWPTSLGEVTLSQRDGTTIIECTANFSYDYFKII
jgi:hypothetical protein